jgi:hypothetical protein
MTAMGLLGSVMLLLVAALACERSLGKHLPSLRFWLQALSPLSGLLGLGAAISGLYCTIKMVAYLGFIRYAPVVYIGSLAAGMASFLLGLRYGYTLLLVWFGRHLSSRQRQLVERMHAQLCENESTLGAAGLVFGSFCALLNIVK